jgi:hypothetical protein
MDTRWTCHVINPISAAPSAPAPYPLPPPHRTLSPLSPAPHSPPPLASPLHAGSPPVPCPVPASSPHGITGPCPIPSSPNATPSLLSRLPLLSALGRAVRPKSGDHGPGSAIWAGRPAAEGMTTASSSRGPSRSPRLYSSVAAEEVKERDWLLAWRRIEPSPPSSCSVGGVGREHLSTEMLRTLQIPATGMASFPEWATTSATLGTLCRVFFWPSPSVFSTRHL